VGQFRTLSQTCLGRQGPEGGVVLGLHLDYDDSYIVYDDLCIFYDIKCLIIIITYLICLTFMYASAFSKAYSL
jgi:hypothetical protein